MRRFVLFLALSLVALGQQANSTPPSGVLTGRVVNALTGEGVNRASVTLSGMMGSPPGMPPNSAVILTDASGYFRATELADGRYQVSARHQAYPTGYSQMDTNEPKMIVVGGANPTKDIVISLSPGASLAGRVMDADGEPLVSIVELIEKRFLGAAASFLTVSARRTDESGEFQFHAVAPGRYYVRARPSSGYKHPQPLIGKEDLAKLPKLDYVPTYFGGGQGVETATRVLLKAGDKVGGVEILVKPVQTVQISGKLRLTSGSDLPPQVSIRLMQKGEGTLIASTMVQPNGKFSLPTLAAGSYVLHAMMSSPQKAIYGTLELEVGEKPIDDLDFVAHQSVDIPVHVTVETPTKQDNRPGQSTPANVVGQIFLQPVSFSPTTIPPQIKKIEDGKFVIQGLVPGSYRFQTGTGYVKSIRWLDKESTGQILKVASGESGQMEVVLSQDYAQLGGTVQDLPKESRMLVVLLPEAEEIADIGSFVMAQVTPEGQIQGRGQPGSYRAACIPGVGLQYLQNPAVARWMKDQGTKVKLEAGSTVSLQLKAISKEAFENLLREMQEKDGR
ncbi:MSCRAMM family protein [Bryobacter aggregatus]|uniref:MSCRAMM family protein n=1 Tax=Bryobacter aggregatus TaxID=360054 RepID=UPI0004E198B0|nr:carboxypeptidase-like regulatory domain-containing protein [Bryobacter aggregatus]